VPTAYGQREIVIRRYVHEVVISRGGELIARHSRSYEREDFVFDPLHYLPLLDRRSALSTRRRGWSAGTYPKNLPRSLARSRPAWPSAVRQTGVRPGLAVAGGVPPEDVLAGVRGAIARGVIGFDAVKHLVLCRIERPAKDGEAVIVEALTAVLLQRLFA
jgi:hypothetical protein